jgi:hypothetical protein
MQKISTYLYPNRIELLADLAGFTVEYTNVYQRNIKIYAGIDNTLEFDIKNADQKRINLTTLTNIELNIMDASGQALPNSPYIVTPLNQTTYKGLASVTLPQDDLDQLDHQFLSFSVSGIQAGKEIMLYGDTRFGAVGKMELVGDAMPTIKDEQVATSFYKNLQYGTDPIEYFHSSAIPLRFYEAVPSTEASVEFRFSQLIGTVKVEVTKDASISSETFTLRGTVLDTFVVNSTTAYMLKQYQNIEDYTYMRVTYNRTDPLATTGTITKVSVS